MCQGAVWDALSQLTKGNDASAPDTRESDAEQDEEVPGRRDEPSTPHTPTMPRTPRTTMSPQTPTTGGQDLPPLPSTQWFDLTDAGDRRGAIENLSLIACLSRAVTLGGYNSTTSLNHNTGEESLGSRQIQSNRISESTLLILGTQESDEQSNRSSQQPLMSHIFHGQMIHSRPMSMPSEHSSPDAAQGGGFSTTWSTITQTTGPSIVSVPGANTGGPGSASILHHCEPGDYDFVNSINSGGPMTVQSEIDAPTEGSGASRKANKAID
ncbi:hypothetical protein LX32DRAFT_709837 [Colletotrichum zoysiae]|uniref:Uncharacterized protein n=1 Tax=Colletotrichum zoysiae TaxID=1216348 RepID=A0AAD9H531_9PEZI|nr:hypothetical protein LX32DRAFT_709837 [Colletotrichum zoysiae]